MKLRLTAAAALLFITPGTAFASDEPEPPSPSIGEPVITIPIDTEVIAQLIVTNLELTPTTGLAPGDSVRLVAQIAAGSAPSRTVIVIDGAGEIVGDVEVAPDGSIDHTFTLPTDLPAGSHSLSLAALELGTTPLGVIEVAQPAAPAPSTTAAESPPGAPAPTTAADQAIDEPADDESGLPLALTIAASVFVGLILLMVFLDRRRKRTVARFEGAASLPTATQRLHIASHYDDVAGAGAAVVPVIAARAEPDDDTDAAPADTSERDHADESTELDETDETEPTDLDVAAAATATATPDDSQPGDDDDTEGAESDDDDETAAEPDDTAATTEPEDPQPDGADNADVAPAPVDTADEEAAEADETEPTELDVIAAVTADPHDSPSDDAEGTEGGATDDAEPVPQADEVLVVELTARGAEGADPPAEQVLGVFSDVERAKDAARRARQEGDSDRTDEVWWEVRLDRGPVWMIHAWAPREYDINSETGEATAASR
jgi:hypothetical protein